MPEVTLRLKQHAALGRAPRGTAPVDTHRHVPGTVLRGALARTWMSEHGKYRDLTPEQQATFRYLFEGPVRYGPLFDPDSDVVPLSVLRCKYRPEAGCVAFFHDEAEHNEAERHNGAKRDSEANGQLPRCDACGGRTEPGRGEVEFFDPTAGDPTVQTTRVQLDANERAAEGQLFTRRALAARTHGHARVLTGRLVIPDPERADWLLHDHRISLGGRRSTSGAARYRVNASEPAPPDPAALLVNGTLLVRLVSPALLVDAAGGPTDRPDPAQLAAVLGLPDTAVTVGRAWVRREHVGGWNALTNLPKPTELAVSAGSVFRLRLATAPSAAGLARLLDHGLGLRRGEGFGAVALGPWTRPRPAPDHAATTASVTESPVDQLAEELCAVPGGSAWLYGQLHDCLFDRRSKERANLAFLRSRRAEPLHHLSDRIAQVVSGDVTELERLVVRLEAHRRQEPHRLEEPRA